MLYNQTVNLKMQQSIYITAATILACMTQHLQADILQSYKDYVSQFSDIEHLSLDAKYTRAMTLVPAPDTYINAVAEGRYRYIFSQGKFRVDCDIAPTNEDSAPLAQTESYAFNGELYQVESPLTGAQQVYETEPLAGTDFPMNPLIMNIAYLSEGHPIATLLGVENFANCESCEKFLDKASIMNDAEGKSYLLLRPKLPDNPSPIEYHVYLREFSTGPMTTRQLPYKQIMFSDGVEQAIIHTMGYKSVSPGDLVLPTSISFTLIENNEATIEFAADIESYSTLTPKDEVFNLKSNESLAQIDEYGIIRTPEGRAGRVPEPRQGTNTETKSKQGLFHRTWFRIVGGLTAMASIGIALAIYRNKQ